MKAFSIELKEYYSFLQGGKLQCCIMDESPREGYEDSSGWCRPAVIVVPGGAYEMVSRREGETVATRFIAQGFQAFTLTYLCKNDGVRYPEQLLEVASAVDYIKKNAKELRVNPDEVFVVGFSAGGHLTANLAVEYASCSQKAGVALDCKPTAVGLSYPVITSNHGHQGSYNALLNGYSDEAKTELLKTLNLDEAVDETTAPAFIWTTAEDTCVPADNAIRFALALSRKGVAYELHVYPRGNHGLSTGDREICFMTPTENYCSRMKNWPNDCAAFFRMYTKEDF